MSSPVPSCVRCAAICGATSSDTSLLPSHPLLCQQGRRFSRPKRLNAYKQWLEQFAADAEQLGPRVPGAFLPPESADEVLLDSVMLRLRLADGLDLSQLAARHPQGEEAAALVAAALRPHVERGWAVASNASSSGSSSGGSAGGTVRHVRLADPQGFVMSNDIISDVFAALDITQ